MRTNRPALCAARWIIPDTDSVDAMVEAALTEQAWLIALGCGKHAHRGMVWAEGIGRPQVRPRPRETGAVRIPVIAEEG